MTAHYSRGHGQEVRAVVPRHCFAVNQADIGLVDERGRLQTVPCSLARHATSRNAMEFLVDERDQLLERTLVALSPSQQQSGDRLGIASNPAILGPFKFWSAVPAS